MICKKVTIYPAIAGGVELWFLSSKARNRYSRLYPPAVKLPRRQETVSDVYWYFMRFYTGKNVGDAESLMLAVFRAYSGARFDPKPAR